MINSRNFESLIIIIMDKRISNKLLKIERILLYVNVYKLVLNHLIGKIEIINLKQLNILLIV